MADKRVATAAATNDVKTDPADDLRPAVVLVLRCFAGFFLFAAVWVAGILASSHLLDGTALDPEGIVAAVLLTALALGLLRGASVLQRSRARLDLPTLGGWVFTGAGGLMMAGGVAAAFNDPAALLMIPFGAVFVGAGFLARKLFSAPPGKRYVAAASHSTDVQTATGLTGQRLQQTLMLVDEHASDADIAQQRRAWAHERFADRPDWVAGRVQAEGARAGGLHAWACVIWALLAGGCALAAWLADAFFWWMAGFFALGAVFWLAVAARTALHTRRFGESVLVMTQTPVYLGERLVAELRSGVPQRLQQQSGKRFSLTLRCRHCWEETVTRGDRRTTHLHSKVLWSASAESPGHPYMDMPIRQAARVAFDIPSNLPESTLGSTRTGIFWELDAHLPLSGMDFRGTYRLPVLRRDTLPGADDEPIAR